MPIFDIAGRWIPPVSWQVDTALSHHPPLPLWYSLNSSLDLVLVLMSTVPSGHRGICGFFICCEAGLFRLRLTEHHVYFTQ